MLRGVSTARASSTCLSGAPGMLRRKAWFKTWNETRHEPGKGNGVSARPCEGMKGTCEACRGEESDYPNLGMREYCGIPLLLPSCQNLSWHSPSFSWPACCTHTQPHSRVPDQIAEDTTMHHKCLKDHWVASHQHACFQTWERLVQQIQHASGVPGPCVVLRFHICVSIAPALQRMIIQPKEWCCMIR